MPTRSNALHVCCISHASQSGASIPVRTCLNSLLASRAREVELVTALVQASISDEENAFFRIAQQQAVEARIAPCLCHSLRDCSCEFLNAITRCVLLTVQ